MNVSKSVGSQNLEVSEECVPTSMNASKDVESTSMCVFCQVNSLERDCGCVEVASNGIESTNQRTDELCAVKHFTHTKGGTISNKREGAQVQHTVRNFTHMGRGNKVTIPAVFSISSQENACIDPRKLSSSNGESNTPVKRKLIQNANTRTLLKVFERDQDEQPVMVGGR